MEAKPRRNPWLKRIVFPALATIIALLWWSSYYDRTNPKPAFTLKTDAVGTLRAAAISPDGKVLLTTRGFSRADSILFWDIASREQIGGLEGPDGEITCLRLTSKGDLLACSSKDGTVKLWATLTWTEVSTLHHDNAVLGIDFSPDGTTLAAATAHDGDSGLELNPNRGGVDLWDLRTMTKKIALSPKVGPASSVVFSEDGAFLAIGCIDGTIVIWDATKGEKRLTLTGHTSEVLSVGISPDNKTLVSGSADHSARLWRFPTGELQAVLVGHQDRVFSAVFSPDGQFVATASDDETIRLWRRETASQIIKIRPHSWGTPKFVLFSPDQKWLIVGLWNGLVKFWELKELVVNSSTLIQRFPPPAFGALPDHSLSVPPTGREARLQPPSTFPVKRLRHAPLLATGVANWPGGPFFLGGTTCISTEMYVHESRVPNRSLSPRLLKGQCLWSNGMAGKSEW